MKIVTYFVLWVSLVHTLESNAQISNIAVSKEHKVQSFDFDGNYLITTKIFVNAHLFNSIEIGTRDSLGGSFIYIVVLRFTNLKTKDYHTIDASYFSGTKDNFSIVAKDDLLGDIEINGKFLGTKGPRNDNVNPRTIVFEGRFRANGKIDEKIACTYFEGD